MKTILVYGESGDIKIKNLRQFLRITYADEVIIRTTYVSGGWHDNEFDANLAGFSISRGQYKEWEDKHQFADAYFCYRKDR